MAPWLLVSCGFIPIHHGFRGVLHRRKGVHGNLKFMKKVTGQRGFRRLSKSSLLWHPSFPGRSSGQICLMSLSNGFCLGTYAVNFHSQISLLSSYDPQSIVRFAGRANVGQHRPVAKQKMHNLHTTRNFYKLDMSKQELGATPGCRSITHTRSNICSC